MNVGEMECIGLLRLKTLNNLMQREEFIGQSVAVSQC